MKEKERYIRHKNLVSEKVQEQVIAVIGAGGLGSFCIRELVSLGVKELRIIEYDKVEYSNLNRQILYKDKDVGKDKIHILEKILSEFNPQIKYRFYKTKITKENIGEILRGCTFVFDCVDNICTRKIVNEFCIKEGLNIVEGGVEKKYGFAGVFNKSSPCLNCMGYFHRDIESKKEVIVTTVAVTASFQVELFLKVLNGEEVFGRLYQLDMNSFEVEKIDFNIQQRCKWHGGDKGKKGEA